MQWSWYNTTDGTHLESFTAERKKNLLVILPISANIKQNQQIYYND